LANYGVNINFRINDGPLDRALKKAGLLDKKANAFNKKNLEINKASLKILKQELLIKNKILKTDQGILKTRKEQVKTNKTNVATQTNRSKKLDGRSNKAALTSGLISGAFPLLFGQGIIGGAAGFAGGAIGTKIGGQMGGFAGGLVATALLQQIQQIGSASVQTADKLNTLTGKLELARERSLFTSKQTEELARQLERQGKVQQLNNLLNEEYQRIIGTQGVQNLSRLNDASKEFGRLMGILKTRFDAFIAGPLSKLIEAINKTISANETAKEFRRFRSGLKGSQKEFFEEELDKARGTRGKSSGPLTISVMEKMLQRFGQRPLMPAKGLGKSKSKEILLGEDKMADLEKEIEIATLKNELSEKDFEIEMKIREIKKGTLGLEEDEIKTKLEKLYVLKNEQQELQRTRELFDGIANSIETGIVDAIEGAINGTKTLGDVARSVFAQIQRSLIQYGVNAFLGGIGLPGFANGGRPPVGRPSIVGEKGPELFVPDKAGTIIPNHQLGGSTNVVVNVDASGSSVEGDEEQGRQLGLAISAAVQSEIIQQKRPGGLLA
tara:strand:+ start:1946 stop:3607 length:1662 start_codon:yes stop_codon:yes gene_type:complete